MSPQFKFAALPPLSLYIHLPWCERKCPYCDFNSHEKRVDPSTTLRTSLDERRYVRALITDLDQDLPRIWGRPVVSVFIGGGTPSLFSPEALDELFSALRARLAIRPDAEVTLEANPGSSEYVKFKEFRAIGINRLSIGVQSFNDASLKRLGRIHGRKEALRAAECAHEAGFDNFNLDLMYGLPEQSLKDALEDLHTAFALEPRHLSHYQLTLEPNTLFHQHPPPLPDDDLIGDMQTRCQAELAGHGYENYEVSAYAQKGARCKHNLNYWQFGDYLGIGAGAHGKITGAQQQTITRLWKLKQPHDYMDKSETPARIGGENTLTPADAAFEFMLNALRLTEGVPLRLFTEHTGLPLSFIEQSLKYAEQRGLVEWNVQGIRPTEQGQRYLNDLTELFLPPTTGAAPQSPQPARAGR
ncbi:MAG: radical SAM family heme chaperone HemW [Gammaproteobacteria bacterium]|nr:radical SAM family heme chaperone HemW [Gammaproteobacteria bacterium]